jgi:hypothetical protein
MAEQRGDRLEAHAAVDGLSGKGVTQLMGVDLHLAASADSLDNAADQGLMGAPCSALSVSRSFDRTSHTPRMTTDETLCPRLS